MPSTRTTARRAAARAEDSSPDQVASSILVLVSGIERHDPSAPAALAFRSALLRKGQDLVEAGGPAALADMLARIRAADPNHADAREAVITAAWVRLTGRET